jgi:hypothetical protein
MKHSNLAFEAPPQAEGASTHFRRSSLRLPAGSNPLLRFEAMTLAMLAFSLIISARAAWADEALNLTWDECPGGGGVADHVFDCNTNFGDNTLFLSFTLAQPVTGVIGIECVVDLQSAAAALPPWWELGTGGCRQGIAPNLVADASFGTAAGCVNPWHGTPAALIQGYSVAAPDHPDSNQARIKVVASVPSDSASDLAAAIAYYGVKIVIQNDGTTGPGFCGGCLASACLVLNSILVRRFPGAPGGDILLTTPGAGTGNWATWRSGAGANCALVPVRRRTWGQLKAIYH